MNPYLLSIVGSWPYEKYVFNINRDVIDFRYINLPTSFIISPYYSEDNNLVKKEYSSPNIGFSPSFIGVSSNKSFVYNDNNYEIETIIESDTTITWTPSSIRKNNFGNHIGCMMLRTTDNNFFGVVTYPTQLFLYPKKTEVLTNYANLTTDTLNNTFSSLSELNYFYTTIQQTSAQLSASVITSPILSSLYNVVTSYESFGTDIYSVWYQRTSSINFSTVLNFNSSIDISITNTSLSSYSYYLPQTSINYFLNDVEYQIKKTEILNNINYYNDFTILINLTSVNYKTTYLQLTSKTYSFQTSSVLLSSDNFQFSNQYYSNIIKGKHSEYLSKAPAILPLNTVSLSSIKYSLSGNITQGNKELIKFTDSYNPITYNVNLEKLGCKIRPDTIKLSYFIQYIDYTSKNNTIRSIGDTYDDYSIDTDNSLEASYILNNNHPEKTLTFQLLQSAIDPSKSMESLENCVLSAFLNYDTCNFRYQNRGIIDFDASYAIFTPISGVPNTSLKARYIADSSFILDNETVHSTVYSLSSFPSINLNTPTSLTNHNNCVNWELKYPPYYYSFKVSYNDNKQFTKFENETCLNFYLSSTVLSNVKNTISENFEEHYSEIDLYTSVYSDFDLIELPLKDYGDYDYIKYEIANTDQSFIKDRIKAYILSSTYVNSEQKYVIASEYDILNPSYVRAISGCYLRVVYNLTYGGTDLTIKPSLSTLLGNFDAYWSTTFPIGTDYVPRNLINPILIDTLNQDISSITLSVARLTSDQENIDLTMSNIVWTIDGDYDDLIIENKTKTAPIGDDLTILQNNSSYPFYISNEIKISGITNKPFYVTLSAVFYETKTTLYVDPYLFDLYYEKRIDVVYDIVDDRNKIKLLKLDCKVPFFNDYFNVGDESSLLWKWDFDNINTVDDVLQITAFSLNSDIELVSSLDLFYEKNYINDLPIYTESNILLANNISSLYVLIDVDISLSEKFYPFDVSVEVYDSGQIITGSETIYVNSYPDTSIFSTDFKIVYPKFENTFLVDTISNLRSMTRPPIGTNILNLSPTNINNFNTDISSLKWVINSVKSPLSSSLQTNYTYTSSYVKNVSGFFDPLLTYDFNNYIYNIKNYRNLEYINGISSVPILNQTQFDLLCSYLDISLLSSKNQTLEHVYYDINFYPLATSLYVTTTSFYTSSFNDTQGYNVINSLPNVYSKVFYTCTINLNQTEYTSYYVDYWLSSINIFSSDDNTLISSFSSDYISNNYNLVDFFTVTNYTTSVDYNIKFTEIEKNAYYEHDISLIAENVSIQNWNKLYNFKKNATVVISTAMEFDTFPTIFSIPKFVWIPDFYYDAYTKQKVPKKTNKFLKILSLDDYDSTYKTYLTGKTYGNLINGYQSYDIILQGIQDFELKANDPVQIVFGVNTSNKLNILSSQIIDTPSEYSIYGSNEIRINDLKIPIYPEIYLDEGMTLSVTAFNRFFKSSGGYSYYLLPNLSSTELDLLYYPITSQTESRVYDLDDNLINQNIININPKLDKYQPIKLLFYPETVSVNLDKNRIIKVKQILETDPINSPNIIDYENSFVTYQLSSKYWVVSAEMPAVSNGYLDVFYLTVGDPYYPLNISDYEVESFILTASALVASKITDYTFNNYSLTAYTEDRELWDTVYSYCIGNEETTQQYKTLYSKVSSISSQTGMLSTYDVLAVNNNYIITI
jgi:hypothetical protein